MIARYSVLVMLAWMLAMPVFAAENLDAWNYFAPIHIEGNNQYKTFFLTEAVYEHASTGLTDLRIVDGQGESVPFYIPKGSFVKMAQVDFDVKADKNDSLVTFSNQQKLAIKQIFLEVEGNFQRNYKVYGDKQSGVPLKSGELYNLQLENVKVSGTGIDLSSTPTSAPTITIKIDNRDDRPLTIKSIKVEYYIDKVIFPNMGSTSYQLHFGNDKATKPNYEIELQKVYIEKEQQDVCKLGDVQVKHNEVPAPQFLYYEVRVEWYHGDGVHTLNSIAGIKNEC